MRIGTIKVDHVRGFADKLVGLNKELVGAVINNDRLQEAARPSRPAAPRASRPCARRPRRRRRKPRPAPTRRGSAPPSRAKAS